MSQALPPPSISTLDLFPEHKRGWRQRALAKTLDAALGVGALNRLYRQFDCHGVSKLAFAQRFMEVFDLTLAYDEAAYQNIPKQGPVIVVANHPFGGIEGVAMAKLLTEHRADTKLFVNEMLRIIPELRDFFIFTNPLANNAKGNAASLRACQQHLEGGGLLFVFPAGSVSHSVTKHDPVTDGAWNRMITSLARKTDAQIVPCFIDGQNRPLFYRLGHVHERLRMAMLIREMLAGRGKTLRFHFGQPSSPPPHLSDAQQQTDVVRLLSYLQNPALNPAWPDDDQPATMQPLAEAQPRQAMMNEVAALPASQCLARHKTFATYWAMRAQCPTVVEDIRRLRERVFRLLDEGSGQPQDGDDLDDTYVQLFVVDEQAQEIIGAYRMGRTDLLQKDAGMDGLYLSQMFDFNPNFINQTQPCLEMGRSFVVPEHQRGFHGLNMLFQGIAGFVRQHPEYRCLYGTVSLSKQYSQLSVALVNAFLAAKQSDATPKRAFSHPGHHEIHRYLDQYGSDLKTLEWLVKQVEPDGKGLPVLLKKYAQLGAVFHCIGIDPNFATTPGLLLSVDLSQAPERMLKRYFANQLPDWAD